MAFRFLCLRRIITVLALVFLPLAGARAADKHTEAEALFSRAQALIQPTASEQVPYSVRGHFKVISEEPLEGTYMRAVAGQPHTWREEVSLPGYRETVVSRRDGKWVRRDADLTPEPIRALRANMTPWWTLSRDEKVKKIVEITLQGTAATCVVSERAEVVREHCFQKATGLPARKRNPEEPWNSVAEYGDYTSVASRQIPRKVRLTREGHFVVELWIDSVSMDVPDDALFAPLSDGKYWPSCEHMKRPAPIYTSEPDYIPKDRSRVELQLSIDTEGRTHDIGVVSGSGTEAFDAAAKAAVSKWRFQPAMCGNERVPFETSVEVNSRVIR